MYLEIIYHDNDFTIPVCRAVKKLWEYIDDGNITDSCSVDIYSIADLFKKLNKNKALLPMIQRLYAIECVSREVEELTEGLTSKDTIFHELIMPNPNKIEYENTYLRFKLKFHKDGEFMMEDGNRERCAINLEKGIVIPF